MRPYASEVLGPSGIARQVSQSELAMEIDFQL
ncbi:hypothetical protein SBV1_2900002 [Verrucomicrobia bacterium]|nr:hypothetical protein SBV1_2900002 [Verrucomicrobiota bacterium]